MTKKKEIHFLLPLEVWEQLLRIFPGKGERSSFFRQMAQFAIELGPEHRFVELIKQRVLEKGDKL